ncbi:unnamed protein product [Phytomonas sp. Hart1]|nr:unnamed protein product [Phytomonas sp. Hart1]|eukprot:CCW70132.1 unnamed protein product [Phytomonas sp. isolate Hart1]
MSTLIPKTSKLTHSNLTSKRKASLGEIQLPRRQSFTENSLASSSISDLESSTEQSSRPPPIGLILMSMVSDTYQTLTAQFMGLSVMRTPLLQNQSGSIVSENDEDNEDYFRKNIYDIRRTLKRLYKELFLLENLSSDASLTTDPSYLRSNLLREWTRNRSLESVPLLRAESKNFILSSSLPDIKNHSSPLKHYSPSDLSSLESNTISSRSLPNVITPTNLSIENESDFIHDSKLIFQDPPFHLQNLKLNMNRAQPEKIGMDKHSDLNPIENSLGESTTNVDMRSEVYSTNNTFSPSATGSIPPFPIISNLKAGNYTLILDNINGFDLDVPLNELKVTIFDYRMVYEKKEYVLRPFSGRTLPRKQTVLSAERRKASYAFHTPTFHFTLENDHQLAVFALMVRHFQRLVCWAVLCAVDLSVWEEPLRGAPYNIKRALKYDGQLLENATISGEIQPVSPNHSDTCGTNHKTNADQSPSDDSDDDNSRLSSLSDSSASGDDENDPGRRNSKLNANASPKQHQMASKPSALRCSLLSTSEDRIEPDSPTDHDAHNEETADIDEGDEAADITSANRKYSDLKELSPRISGPQPPPTRPTSAFRHVSSFDPRETSASESTASLSTSSQEFPADGRGKLSDRPYRFSHKEYQPRVDREGRLVVPKDYKRHDAPAAKFDLDPFDKSVSEEFDLWEYLGGDSLAESPEPRPRRAASKGEITLELDRVFGVPLNAIYTRVVVYLMDAVEDRSGEILHSLRAPGCFLREPDLIAYQTPASSPADPEFSARIDFNPGPHTAAVVVVEYLTGDERWPIVLGHSHLPLDPPGSGGKFLSRLRLGDPRRSEARGFPPPQSAPAKVIDAPIDLEGSMDAQALHNRLAEAPRTRAACVPMGFLAWRFHAEHNEGSYDLFPGELAPSQQELHLWASRQTTQIPSPRDLGLTEAAVEGVFSAPARLMNDQISFLSLFDPNRGLFLSIGCLRGLGMGDIAVYVIAVHLLEKRTPHSSSDASERDEQKWRYLFCTRPADSTSDVGILDFADPPLVLSDLDYHPHSMVFFTVIKVSFSAITDSWGNSKNGSTHARPLSASEHTLKIEEIGWTANRLFLDKPGILRQGRFALPLLKMSILKNVLRGLKKESFNNIFIKNINEQKSSFISPKTTLTVAQGDPACMIQILSDLPGQPQIHKLLMPLTMRNSFPTNANEGAIGYTLKSAYESNLRMDEKMLTNKVCFEVDKYLKQNSGKIPG